MVPLAAVACFALGLALGFPALRVQHHYLAFATLGFNVLVYLVMRNEEKITGGTFGISGIPRRSMYRRPIGTSRVFLLHAWRAPVLGFGMWWLLRSPWGRAFAALRDNPIRAESLGVNITAYTLLAFAIGAACAGVAGVFYASLVEFIEPGPFHFSTSLLMLLAVIVGGSGKFFGPVIGTVIIVLLPELLRGLDVAMAQVHADLVSRGIRARRRRADDLAAGRAAVDPDKFRRRRSSERRRHERSSRSSRSRTSASTTGRSRPSTASRFR